jgi:hypothetical protein
MIFTRRGQPVRGGMVPAQLRRMSRRMRHVAVAASASLRRYVRRHQPKFQCAVVLIALAVTTYALAYLCWQAAIDERLRLAAAEPPPKGTLIASPEVLDPTRDIERTVERPRGASERDDGRGSERRGDTGQDRRRSVTVEGPVLASVGSGAVMCGGTAAAWAIVSRYRRRLEEVQAPAQPLPLPAVLVPEGEDEPVDPANEAQDELTAVATEVAAEAVMDAPTDAPTDELAEKGTIEGTDQPPDGAPVLSTGTAHPASVNAAFQDSSHPGSWSYGGHDVTAGASGRHVPAADEAGRQFVTMALPVTPTPPAQGRRVVEIAGQRIFERRTAPRVDYVHAAELHVRGRVLPVETLDLSESGLRCGAEVASSTPATELPKPGDFVRVVFSAADVMVSVSAQVAWQRRIPDGRELGLSFRGLSECDLSAIRAACYGASLGSP